MTERSLRRQDWAERLSAYLERPHAFSWTETNCGQFAAGAVREITGLDVGAPFRGAKTRRGQLALLKRIAKGDVEAAATMIGGAPLPSPLSAQRGDVVSVETAEGPALGVCVGKDVVVLSPDSNLVHIPLTKARKAWRTG